MAAETETSGVTSMRGGESSSCHVLSLTVLLTLLFQVLYLYQVNSHTAILQSRQKSLYFIDVETEAQRV